MSWVLGPDDEVKNTVRELLATNKTMFLSTSANDRPWVAGVYFAESDPFHLTLILEAAGRSLANIRANPNVAVTVSSCSPFDLYLQGKATRRCSTPMSSSRRQNMPCERKRPRSSC